MYTCMYVYIYMYIQLHLDFKFGSISCHSQNVPRTLQNEDQIVFRALSERRDWRMGYFDVFTLFSLKQFNLLYIYIYFFHSYIYIYIYIHTVNIPICIIIYIYK